MMIPKYLPEFFQNHPLNDKETSLLKSLGNKSAAEYERLISEFAQDIDIRSEIIRTKLNGFETAFERIRLDEIKSEITSCQSQYELFLKNLRETTAKIQEKQLILAGLECAIRENLHDSELMEYFQCNKNLTIVCVNGTAIEFVVHGYADIFDIDAFEQYVGNHNGFMYNGLNPAISKAQMERLYRAIFADGQFKLRICAAFTADIRNGLRAMQHYNFPQESVGYLPNPHIQDYGCIGTYAGRFHEYMQKRDYVGGIDQAVVSARNLNFYDSTVISSFVKKLSYTEIPCIEATEGTLLTPMQAIQKLEGGTICHDQS